MPEQQFEITPVGVRYICDKCGEGEMVQSGKIAWMTDPIQFPHQCTKCGHEQAFTDKYPTVRFVTPNVKVTGLAPEKGA
jgi:uncharacterized protein (DUF983 family)